MKKKVRPNSSKNAATSRVLRISVLVALTISTGAAIVFFGPTSSAQWRSTKSSPPTPIQGFANQSKISDAALAQMAALIQEKETRTPIQQKIDSQLLYKLKMMQGQSITSGIPTLETDVSVDDVGYTEVDIRANVDNDLLSRLSELNAMIVDSLPQYRTIVAKLPVDQIETVAALKQVIFIQPNFRGNVWKATPGYSDDKPIDLWQAYSPQSSLPGFRTRPALGERAAMVRKFLDDNMPQVGSQQSQGDITHQANLFRANLGPDGSGLKIGVLSNGATSRAASQALGDLGPVTVLTGQGSSGDEGTAMLEIVHDLAPGAQLYFASANATPARFAQNIKDLRAAGCDIIIDDVFYFVESPFQDGQTPNILSTTNGSIITQAVNDVTADGALYFSSAGNQGNVDDSTASCYQGDFVAAAPSASPLPLTGSVHDFGSGAQFDLIQTGSGSAIDLYWADPLGGSSNDYDLFVVNSTGTALVSASTNIQNGTQDPFEQAAGNTTNNRVVVLKKTGAADRFFQITINANGAGRLGTATPGTTKGHSMAANAFSVGATPAAAGVGSVGPFPGPFVNTNVTETFSSDGPRRIFFNPDGSAITPGNFSSTGGLLRQKPDITAADGVAVTGVGGFGSPFFGTSAAAPHAGAIAALLKSSFPHPTNAQIRAALLNSAIDIEGVGVDRDSGAGIIMPLAAATNLGITAQAVINEAGQTVAEAPGFSDLDGQLENGERGNVVISQLTNVGALTATGVTATLSTTTPGVDIITPDPFPYADLASGGGSQSNSTPYQFFLGPAYACGTPIDFVLTVNFTDTVTKSQVIKFSADPGTSIVIPTTTLDATPPTPPASFTAAMGTQTNRVTRNGEGTSCSLLKAYPGTTSTAGATPRFDAYTFTAPSSGCTTLTMTGTTSTAAFAVVYNGPFSSFNPASISTNYLADMGLSPLSGGSLDMAFGVTAGQQYTIVVSEVTANSAPSYALKISGSPLATCQYVPIVSLGGRVTTSAGRSISQAVVTITDGVNTRITRSNAFGYFFFDNVANNQNYTIQATDRRYTFTPQVISVSASLSNINFVAN